MSYSDNEPDPYPFRGGPMERAAFEAEADRQRMAGFLTALQGGIAAEGNSREELEEISGELAKTSGMVPTGETSSWKG